MTSGYLTAEARARVSVDHQLGACGWAVQDRSAMNLYAAQGVAVREFIMAPGHGRADYLLFVGGQAVGAVEAKPSGTPLAGVEPQSAKYAAGLPNRDVVTPRFLLWQLVNAHVAGVTVSLQTATTNIRNLKMNDYWEVQFSVPPLAEQERIVAAIEEAFSKLDAGEAGLRTVRQLLKRMRDAILAAAVTGRLVPQDPTDTPVTKLLSDLGIEPIEPEGVPVLRDGWEWVALGDIADVVGGVTKDSKREDDPTFVERPYLRVANVQRGYLDLDVVTTIRVAPEKAAKLELRPGDVLLNEGGDRDKLGRGWVWEGQVEGCIHQNHVFRARLAGGIEPKLVSIWGNTFGQGWFDVGDGSPAINVHLRW